MLLSTLVKITAGEGAHGPQPTSMGLQSGREVCKCLLSHMLIRLNIIFNTHKCAGATLEQQGQGQEMDQDG